ncbi:MAG: site-specific integrase [Tannerella sp.]|jgi:site-specific recombinase XerD|nr:site-specific integrase [Tannerella sp.]
MVKQYQTFSELMDEAAAYLSSLSYSSHMVDYYRREWRYLGDYMREKGIQMYDTQVGSQYLAAIMGETKNQDLSRSKKRQIRMITSLSDFFMTGTVRKRKPHSFPDELEGAIGKLISDYLIVNNKLNNYVAHTVQSNTLCLSRFLDYLNGCNIKSIEEINPDNLMGFVQKLQEYSDVTRHIIILQTNKFLKYLYNNRILESDYSTVIPKCNYVRQPRLPSYYSEEEICRLIQCIDRSNSVGKRDYAIILLIARLGLRRSDVCSLKFENIYWEARLISLIQHKTKRPVELPLFDDIGNAIIDYLKYGRPKSNQPYVFLRLIPPCNNLDSNGITCIIQKYLRHSGINYDERKHGPHALRHSLASNLLKQETPLPVISCILGHSSTESTIDYLRIDVQSLKKCALEVPCIGERKEDGNEI